MTTPKISVIIPIYNDELYLADTLQSVCNQTFSDFECICVNDGSVDNTEKIIDQFIEKDNRLIKINQPNGGVSIARNTGIGVAKGEFLFFVDHDDLLPVDALHNLLTAAEKFGADMARGRMMMIPDNFAVTEIPKQQEHNQQSYFFEDPLTDFYRHTRGRYKTWCYIWQCLFRYDAVRNIRFVESLRSGREDNLFMYEVVANIKNFVQLDSVVACHRNSKSSIMLSGYKPVQFTMFDIAIPYAYQKYATNKQIDKRLLWWVYHKESYAVYRFLVRNAIRSNQLNLIHLAHQILLKNQKTPAFKEIWKRWSFRQKMFFKLFMKKRYKVLRVFKVFM